MQRGSSLEEQAGSACAEPPLVVAPRDASGQRCVRSLVEFEAGEVVTSFGAASVHDRPSRMTLQVSAREHVTLAPPFLSFLNHGCDPNVFFDVEAWVVLALRPIAAGDELLFFYPSTEWDMAEAFACDCGSPRCLGVVGGAARTPPEVLRAHRLTPHVRRLLHARDVEAFAP